MHMLRRNIVLLHREMNGAVATRRAAAALPGPVPGGISPSLRPAHLAVALLLASPALAQERATGTVTIQQPPPAAQGAVVEAPDGSRVPVPRGGAVEVSGANVVVERETPQGTTLTVQNDVLFDFDKTELRPAAAEALGRVLEIIRQRSPRAVLISAIPIRSAPMPITRRCRCTGRRRWNSGSPSRAAGCRRFRSKAMASGNRWRRIRWTARTIRMAGSRTAGWRSCCSADLADSRLLAEQIHASGRCHPAAICSTARP